MGFSFVEGEVTMEKLLILFGVNLTVLLIALGLWSCIWL